MEELVETEGNCDSYRDLSVSCVRVGDVCVGQGGEENLIRAYELYEKGLEIKEKLVKIEGSIDAYDGLAVGLYKVAMHPFTMDSVRKQYIGNVKLIAKLLYQRTENPRYQKFIEIAEDILKRY